MTVDELRSAIAERRARGLQQLQLVIPRPPGRGERMRVAPGVLGEVACATNDGGTVVWCKLDDLERAIARGRIR